MRLNFAPTSVIRPYARITWKDMLLSVAAPLLAFWLRDPGFLSPERIDIALTYTAMSVAWSIAAMFIFQIHRSIGRYLSPAEALYILGFCATIVAGTTVTSFILSRLDTIPRSFPVLHFITMAVAHLLVRAWSHQRNVTRSRRRLSGSVGKRNRNAIIFGCNRLAWFYIRMLDTFSDGSQKVVALLDDRPNYWGRTLSGRIVAGSHERLPALIDEYAVHGIEIDTLVVASLDESDYESHRADVERLCGELNLQILHLPHALGLREPGALMTAHDAAEAPNLPELSGYWRVKRWIDFVVAAISCLSLVPIFALVIVAVWYDVGSPVFFWQQRIGQNGEPIYVFKFRTLRAPFDKNGKKLNDAERLSPCGRWIRRTRLDELPQLWNILTGEMSFIGPRPLLKIDHPEDDQLRTLVPPGITGYAQVVGGRLITSEEKSALDDWYVLNASLRVDARLVAKTVRFLILGDRRDEDLIRAAIEERAKRKGEAV